MVTVVRWTGLEARILRDAFHMSVRDFSNHIGLSVSAISHMEAKGSEAKLRQATQRILDTTLERAPEDVRRRFEALLADVGPAVSSGIEASDDARAVDQLGEGSGQRTRSLVRTLQAGTGSQLRYLPPTDVVEIMDGFLESSSRVFVLTGAPGCGKTRFVQHLAAELADRFDVQLHSSDVWGDHNPDLAVEILRYASIPTDGDALLTLEKLSVRLHRPCLVTLDCIKGQHELHTIGRQVDVILRQVMSKHFRFVLVIRTPPEIDLSTYPVLASSVYAPPSAAPRTFHRIVPWTAAEATQAWNSSRGPSEPFFLDLPPPVQKLARLPLYMELIKTAGHDAAAGEVDAFRLVDHCVWSILRTLGEDADDTAATLSDLAASQAAELVPETLDPEKVKARLRSATTTATLPLLRTTQDGHVTFTHDVLREYFLAARISDLVIQRGRSLATVATLNELAAQATTGATARGVFDFVVSHIAQHAPDLLAAMALSPTISTSTTLPMTIDICGARLGSEVLRMCARRCVPERAAGLSRSMLATPSAAEALDEEYPAWILELLRAFGSAVWADVAQCVEQSMDAERVTKLLTAAHLDDAEEATFFARHFFVFVSGDHDPAQLLDTLLTHTDWRVRAALAEGIGDRRARGNKAHGPIRDRLIADSDYKVRAAVGRTVGRLDTAVTTDRVRTLLADENWHVRGCALESLAAGYADSDSPQGHQSTVIRALTDDESWRGCPGHVAPLLHRLLLLHDLPAPDGESPAHDRALFTLLREQRTGAFRLPATTLSALTTRASRSRSWLVRREAEALLRGGREASGPSPSEAFRRLREGRSVQVALDLHDLDHAVAVARAAAIAGADFVEVGDPLIKHAGLRAVEVVKSEVPDVAVVAEMMSADWGRDQVAMAAEAGADVVLLIGPATSANVAAAVDAGRRLGVPVVLDIPSFHASPQWVRDMERVGVDGFSITTNIDLGVAGRHPLTKARIVRGWTRLPVAVSGGFGPTDYTLTSSRDWDILIVGRSIVDAVQPDIAVKKLIDIARGTGRAVN